MRRFRIYIDESGDHTYHQLDNIASRYLGLTGVVIESEYYRTHFQPRLEFLKQSHFPHNPDDPVILHRKELINREGPFRVLRDANRDELKLKKKIANIAGLQVADLPAYPLKHDILRVEGVSGITHSTFGGRICSGIQTKQNSYGRKLLK